MALSVQGPPWLLASLALLTGSISMLIIPGGRQTFLENVKHNVVSFSPFRSGAVVTALLVYLIGWRLLNIADIYAGLRLSSYYYFTSDLSDGGWSRFARRTFLIGATLPLYAMLLMSTSYRWIQVFVTLLVAESVLAELLRPLWGTSDEGLTFHRGWPNRIMLTAKTRTIAAPDHITSDHVQNGSKANETTESKEDGHMAPPSALKDNLCDRINQLWGSPVAGPDINSPPHSFSPENAPMLERIFSPAVHASHWTCGHWCCLVYKILHGAVGIIGASWSGFELISTAWLLHDDLQPVTLPASDKMLENSILGGVLTMLYQISLLLALFATGFILSAVLFGRLCKQPRINQALRDLAETAPITYKAIDAFGKLFMPIIMGYISSRALFPHDPSLTRQFLSCGIEILVMLAVYITGYRLTVSPSRPEQAPTEAESLSSSGPYLELDTTPNSHYEGVQNPAVATETHSTLFDDETRASTDRYKYSQTPKRFYFGVFRLAILFPTVAVWIVLYH